MLLLILKSIYWIYIFNICAHLFHHADSSGVSCLCPLSYLASYSYYFYIKKQPWEKISEVNGESVS